MTRIAKSAEGDQASKATTPIALRFELVVPFVFSSRRCCGGRVLLIDVLARIPYSGVECANAVKLVMTRGDAKRPAQLQAILTNVGQWIDR